MLDLCLSYCEVISSVNNVLINSKIWNKIVSWNLCVSGESFEVESSSERFLNLFFGNFNGLLCINNTLIDSKIWYEVISWILRFFLECWKTDVNLPWNSSWWWSESDSKCAWHNCCNNGVSEHLFLN